MSDDAPGIRAHYARLALKRLRAFPEGKGAEIRERVGPGTLARLRDAGSLGWVALQDFIDLCEAILGVLGEALALGFWTDLMRDSYDHGILKPLTMLASAGLGTASVKRLLRSAPEAWALSTRGCGRIEIVEREGGRYHLQGVDLLPEVLRSRGFLCVFHGACQAMLELFKSRGRVELIERRPEGEDRPQPAFAIVFER